MPPRGNLQDTYKSYPAVGAVHPIVPDRGLRYALNEIGDVVDDVFNDGINNALVEWREGFEVPTQNSSHLPPYDPTKYYRLFDAQTLGVSILEADLSAEVAKRARAVWQGNDLGSIRQDLETEAARYLPGKALQLRVGGVMAVGGRLPSAPYESIRSKLAFSFDAASHVETLELMFREHDIAIDAIKARLIRGKKAEQFLPIDFVPHGTFLAYKSAAQPSQVAEANQKINELIQSRESPLIINLGQLSTERRRLVRRNKKPRRH